MSNFFTDNEDLKFYIDKYYDWSELVSLTEQDYKMEDGLRSLDEAMTVYKDVLELFGQVAAEEVAPHVLEIDKQKINFKDGVVSFPPALAGVFDKIKELQVYGMTVPRELGGMNIPFLFYMITIELFARADVSVSAHYGFHNGIAMASLFYSVAEGSAKFDMKKREISYCRFSDVIEDIVSGNAWGSMDITEPGAGSDMANMKTYAEQDKDGNWFVTGQKIYITSGHAKYHFVIARTDKEEGGDKGLKGLSQFLVRAYDDNPDGTKTYHSSFIGVEDKMGHNGSATVAIAFEKSPAELIATKDDGFKQMLLLMNNARIGVGFECLGLSEAAFRMAKAYAADRNSMGKTIDQHEMIADLLDEMEIDIQAIRAMCFEACFHEELSTKKQIKLDFDLSLTRFEKKALEKEIKKHKKSSRDLTPLLKYFASEKAVEISRRNIQIHGGAGYIKEYGAEKLLRDAMVMPIYEGTSQIQSLMAMKDHMMAVIKNPQAFVQKMAQYKWRSISGNSSQERRVAKVVGSSLSALQHIIQKTAIGKIKDVSDKPMNQWVEQFTKNWDPKHDFHFAMLHAERLTRLLIDAAVCEILLKQSNRFPERLPILEGFLERAESRSNQLHYEITHTGERLLSKLGKNSSESTQKTA